MTGDDQPTAIADRARGLTDALNRLSDRLDEVKADSETRDAALTRHSRRNRVMIWVTIVSLVLDILLTAGFAVVAVQAHDASTAATANAQYQQALCQAGNVARAQQIQLWTHLLSLQPAAGTPKRTPAQQKQLGEFRAYIHSVFLSRNCKQLGQRP
jgi:hypothetical protein